MFSTLSLLASLLSDFPFESLEDRFDTRGRKQLIPRVLFQTWEKNSFGRRHKRSILEFRDTNDDLDWVLFTKCQRDDYMAKHWSHRLIYDIYRASRIGALSADIFRYCIVYDLGGYYCDISKGTKLKLTDMHPENSSALLTFEKNAFVPNGNFKTNPTIPLNLVVQWCFGFTSKHPLLSHHINSIEEKAHYYAGKVFSNPKSAILEFTGPVSFTKSLHEYSLSAGLEGITLAGTDFNGNGIYSLPGSASRFLKYPSYSNLRDSKILEDLS